MSTETAPLIGRPSCTPQRPFRLFERRHCIPMLSFIFCLALSVAQLFFQTVVLPPLLITIPSNLGLLISTFSSEIVGSMTELAWVLITNHADKYFHEALFGVELDKKQRDALRKVNSLDTALQIATTKLSVIAGSLVQASSQKWGICLSTVICFALIGLNIGSRWLGGQFHAIERNWEDGIERNHFFNTSNRPAYERFQWQLRQSRLKRVLSDKIRTIFWISGLGLVLFAIDGRLPPGIYAKILKDALSLDAQMEKFLKSCVPAKTLLRAYSAQVSMNKDGVADLEDLDAEL